MDKYKEGDYAYCIQGTKDGDRSLTRGKIYKVTKVYPENRAFITLNGNSWWWSVGYFININFMIEDKKL